jgi:hypothetical protein
VWFPSYHNFAGLKSLGQFLCSNRNVNHGRSTFRLQQARTAFSDPFFCFLKLYQGPKYIEDFQHNTGTAFCRNEVSIRMDRKNQKTVAQVLSMKKEPDARPRPQPTTILNAYVT